MGAVDTTYTFTATDTITSTKMNNIIDQTTITTDAIIGTTLDVASGKLKIRAQGITSNEMGIDSVTSNAILDGAVTQAKASNMLVPSGAIVPFAMNSAPTGWLVADGSSVSTGGANAALFAAIGYTYGGSGGSFNLPDLRGIFVRGSGSQVISGGTFAGTFAQKQAHMFQDHGHAGYTDVQGAHAHTQQFLQLQSGGGLAEEARGSPDLHESTNRWTGTAGAHSHNVQTYGANSGTAGGETRPANIALLYCIKL